MQMHDTFADEFINRFAILLKIHKTGSGNK